MTLKYPLETERAIGSHIQIHAENKCCVMTEACMRDIS